MRRIFERSRVGSRVGMGVAIAALIFCLGWDCWVPARAQPNLAGSQGPGLITHFQQQEGGATRVIVMDAVLRRMAVYSIDGSGAIQLQSVRNLTVDLQVQDFNGGKPSPVDMQKMLQRNN